MFSDLCNVSVILVDDIKYVEVEFVVLCCLSLGSDSQADKVLFSLALISDPPNLASSDLLVK